MLSAAGDGAFCLPRGCMAPLNRHCPAGTPPVPPQSVGDSRRDISSSWSALLIVQRRLICVPCSVRFRTAVSDESAKRPSVKAAPREHRSMPIRPGQSRALDRVRRILDETIPSLEVHISVELWACLTSSLNCEPRVQFSASCAQMCSR
jgi:hypothetical protein